MTEVLWLSIVVKLEKHGWKMLDVFLKHGRPMVSMVWMSKIPEL